MPAPSEWEWRAYAAIRSAHARLHTYVEGGLDKVFDEDLGWAAACGLDEVRRRQDGGGGEDALSDAHRALGRAKSILSAIGLFAGAAAHTTGDKRNEAANEVCWLAELLDELADDDAPQRWADYRERVRSRLAAQRAGAA